MRGCDNTGGHDYATRNPRDKQLGWTHGFLVWEPFRGVEGRMIGTYATAASVEDKP